MDGWTDGRMDGWTPFWGFLDLPLHTTLVTSNYEYRGLKFKNVLFFVLFTVVLPLLIGKLFYLKNWNKNKINLFFLKFSKIFHFLYFPVWLCSCTGYSIYYDSSFAQIRVWKYRFQTVLSHFRDELRVPQTTTCMWGVTGGWCGARRSLGG